MEFIVFRAEDRKNIQGEEGWGGWGYIVVPGSHIFDCFATNPSQY